MVARHVIFPDEQLGSSCKIHSETEVNHGQDHRLRNARLRARVPGDRHWPTWRFTSGFATIGTSESSNTRSGCAPSSWDGACRATRLALAGEAGPPDRGAVCPLASSPSPRSRPCRSAFTRTSGSPRAWWGWEVSSAGRFWPALSFARTDQAHHLGRIRPQARDCRRRLRRGVVSGLTPIQRDAEYDSNVELLTVRAAHLFSTRSLRCSRTKP